MGAALIIFIIGIIVGVIVLFSELKVVLEATDSTATARKLASGTIEVIYNCPKCHHKLRSVSSDIGTRDSCPSCQCAFIVPGKVAFRNLQIKILEKIKREEEIAKKREEIAKKREEEIAKKREEDKRRAKVAEEYLKRKTGDNNNDSGLDVTLILFFMLLILPPAIFAICVASNADEAFSLFMAFGLVWLFMCVSTLGGGSSIGSTSSRKTDSSTAKAINNLTTYIALRDIAEDMADRHDSD